MPRQPSRPPARYVQTHDQRPAQSRGRRQSSSVATRSLFRLRRCDSPPCLKLSTRQEIPKAASRKVAQAGDLATRCRLKRRRGRVPSRFSRSKEIKTAHSPCEIGCRFPLQVPPTLPVGTPIDPNLSFLHKLEIQKRAQCVPIGNNDDKTCGKV